MHAIEFPTETKTAATIYWCVRIFWLGANCTRHISAVNWIVKIKMELNVSMRVNAINRRFGLENSSRLTNDNPKVSLINSLEYYFLVVKLNYILLLYLLIYLLYINVLHLKLFYLIHLKLIDWLISFDILFLFLLFCFLVLIAIYLSPNTFFSRPNQNSVPPKLPDRPFYGNASRP